jgi:ribosome-associated protein
MAMLDITANIRIPETELEWTYVRSGGPGGQNVNKVASKAVLRWNVAATTALPDDVKARLIAQQGRRLTTEGDLLLMSQRFRDQERNRQDCLEKLRAIVTTATIVPKVRKKKKPTRASKERRLAAKKHRAAVKKQRRNTDD